MKKRLASLAFFLLSCQGLQGQTCPPGTEPAAWGGTRDARPDGEKPLVCVDGTGHLLVSLQQLNNIRFADQFEGADWAAKVNAADSNIGRDVPGVIYVPSSMAGTATTPLEPSDNKRIVFMGGTFASSASPNVNLDASGVILEGSGDGSTATATTFSNIGTGDSFVLGSPAGTARRGITLRDFRIVGSNSSGKGLVLRANLGNVRAENIYISTPHDWGVDGTSGNYMHVVLRHVRVDSAREYAFNFSCKISTGPVVFYDTYANGTSGPTSVGYELANGQFSLHSTAADSNSRGYRLGGHVSMIGTASEANTVYGVQVAGDGTITIVGHFSGGDDTPFEIASPHASVQLINPRTVNTKGPHSLVVAGKARGDNALHGTAGLDRPLLILPGGILQQFAPRANQFTGSVGGSSMFTSLNTISFSRSPVFDASLGNTQKMTLTGDVARSSLSNGKAGQLLHFIICQDAAGSRTFTWPPSFHGTIAIGAAPSTCSVQSFILDGTDAWAVGPGVANQ